MYYINKIKNHLSNWFEYGKEHLVRILFIIFLFVIFSILFTLLSKQNILHNNILEQQQILIFGITLENWFTYFSMIALLFTGIWAIYQFDKSISRKQQEKGAEIAKLFSEDLLEKCYILGDVILACGIENLFKLNDLDYRVFKNFDRIEMYNIYDDDSIFLKLRSILFSNDTQQIYLRFLERNVSLISDNELKNKTYSSEDAEKIFILDNSNMPFKFTKLISCVLNELEYISMYIASQSAGSKYVYQSLHQIFLRTIKLLAPIISMQNKDYSDKYFTNIIHVYNEWANLKQFNQTREDKKKERANKILNPKIKTV